MKALMSDVIHRWWRISPNSLTAMGPQAPTERRKLRGARAATASGDFSRRISAKDRHRMAETPLPLRRAQRGESLQRDLWRLGKRRICGARRPGPA